MDNEILGPPPVEKSYVAKQEVDVQQTPQKIQPMGPYLEAEYKISESYDQ